MNYMMKFIKQVGRVTSCPNLLVSGEGMNIKRLATRIIVDKLQAQKRCVVVIGDSEDDRGILNELRDSGYQIKNGMSGKYSISNPLQIGTLLGMSRLRYLLDIMEYDEKQKQKIHTYLLLIKHIENIKGNNIHNLDISTLAKYSSNMAVERIIQSLRNDKLIDYDKQLYLLSKYSEISSSAADFENLLLVLAPFITNERRLIDAFSSENVIYFSFKDIAQDAMIKKVLLTMISWEICDVANEKDIYVIVSEKGGSDSNLFTEFVDGLSPTINMDYFTENVFMLDRNELTRLMSNFPVRIYGRHKDMESCAKLEAQLGNIEVVKKQYTVDRDRRWKMNSALDVLFDNNKVEHYTTNAPIVEAKYKKEYLMTLPEEYAIVEYLGNSSQIYTCKYD